MKAQPLQNLGQNCSFLSFLLAVFGKLKLYYTIIISKDTQTMSLNPLRLCPSISHDPWAWICWVHKLKDPSLFVVFLHIRYVSAFSGSEADTHWINHPAMGRTRVLGGSPTEQPKWVPWWAIWMAVAVYGCHSRQAQSFWVWPTTTCPTLDAFCPFFPYEDMESYKGAVGHGPIW